MSRLVWMGPYWRWVPDCHLVQGQYKREDLIGTSAEDLYADPDSRDAILEAIRQRGRAIDVPAMFRNRDGSLVPCSISATIARGAEGELRTVATWRDITGRQQAERAAGAGGDRYRSLVEQWFAAIVVIQDNELVYCNPAAPKSSATPRTPS